MQNNSFQCLFSFVCGILKHLSVWGHLTFFSAAGFNIIKIIYCVHDQHEIKYMSSEREWKQMNKNKNGNNKNVDLNREIDAVKVKEKKEL